MKSCNRFEVWTVAVALFALPSMAQQARPTQPLMAANDGTPGSSLVAPTIPAQQLSLASSPSTLPQYSTGPRPFVYGGLALSRGGYDPAGGIVGTGLNVESARFLFWAEASADNLHKRDSGTGRDLGLKARVFFTTSRGFFFGGGAQWSKLTTVLYSKQAWRPTFGGGKDFIREDFSMRAQVIYVLPGTDRLNASQGPEISLWLPSPARGRHWFYRQTLGLYEAHQTTVPGNRGTGERFLTSFLNMTVLYRF
jgi:hypothetical protein